MSSCAVRLDNYQGQYYTGNTIVGRVICSFNSSKNVRGIRVKLSGKEHTEWTESKSEYDHQQKKHVSRTVHCSGNNNFLNIESTVAGAGDINPGRHEYTFSFNLPKNSPGSYHGKYGWVKYCIKATVDRPYKIDFEDEHEFNVISLIDLNDIKDSLQLDPVAYSDDKTLCCCCCASGPITMNVHLQKEAFVQGEVAAVKVEIINMANENVDEVTAKIGMTVESKVINPSTHRKTDYEILASERNTGVGAHGERTYNFELQIPESAVVPNFNLCTLFEKWCTLEVVADIEGFHSDMELSTRVVMGHIPVGGQIGIEHVGLQQTMNPMFPPIQGGMPYPSPAPPYPSNTPYSSNQPPYPTAAVPPFQAVPVHASPSNIGFSMPQPGGPPPAVPYPTPYPPGSTPYPTAPGPSAPPMVEASSAPSKEQLAQGDFVMVYPNVPLLGDDGVISLPPPSYNEAMSHPPKH